MQMRQGLVLAISILVLAAAWAIPGAALAGPQCLCANGEFVEAEDDATSCDDACSEMGGGSTRTPQGDEGADEGGDAVRARQPRVQNPDDVPGPNRKP